MGRFSDKTVVVTGASKGLGYYITKEYISEGARVIMIARGEERLRAAADSMQSPNAIVFPADVSKEESWVKLVDFIKTNYGEMDILINNAAIIPGADILNMPFSQFREVTGTNMDGVFLGMKYCHEVLKKDCYSTIVNISSVGGLKAGPSTGNDAGYNASKAAVRNLTKHAAYVFAPDKIRVVSVHPSGINTDMRKQIMQAHPELEESAKAKSPLYPHCNEPEDLAKVVAFLTTPEAKGIDGSEIVVDCAAMAI